VHNAKDLTVFTELKKNSMLNRRYGLVFIESAELSLLNNRALNILL
jgi:hypothetical protein